jgi:UDP-2,3-diacylglucosamine pyrophosphatase LpxH
MILIADSHVSAGNAASFFAMLGVLEKTDHDVVFLGDIFELWIALSRYEDGLHRRFLDWCRQQKARRCVGFVEGNHEFFLCQEHSEAFTWCTPDVWRDASGQLFVHGDLINRQDIAYLRFRKLTKNRFVKFFLRYVPGGPRLAEAVRCKMKQHKVPNASFLPEAELEEFANAQFQGEVLAAFAGHFHQEYRSRGPQGQIFHALPAWFNTGQVALFDAGAHSCVSIPWQELGSACPA